MSLRLRRGTNLERQSVVFAEGELVYTTDTKELYIGDGETLGGILVSQSEATPIVGINSLIEDTNPTLGGTLELNNFNINGTGNIDIDGSISANSFVGDGSGLVNVPITEDQGYRISIVGNDSTLVLDHTNGVLNVNEIITGTIIGDGSGLVNVPITEGQGYKIDVISSTDSIMINSDSNEINAETIFASRIDSDLFSGDGSDLFNVPVTEDREYRFSIVGGDSTLILDHNNSILNINQINAGTIDAEFFSGDGSGLTNLPFPDFNEIEEGGSYRINILGLDSSVILDSESRVINVESVTLSNLYTNNSNLINISNETQDEGQELRITSVDNVSTFRFNVTSESDISNDDSISYGRIMFERNDINGSVTSALIAGSRVGLLFGSSLDGSFSSDDDFMTFSNKNLGIGTFDPEETLDVRGNAIVNGNLVVNNGLFNISSFNELERDELSPSNGSIIYNTDTNKFQGYADGTWVDLH